MVRVGGQAVIEGVMMRAGDRAFVAVRRPDGGIESRPVTIPGWATSSAHIPFARGLAALGEALAVGVGALRWSEQQSMAVRHPDRRPAPAWVMLSIALAAVIALIVVIPASVAGLVPHDSAWFPIVETVTRLGVAGAYVWLAGRRSEVRRVFEYHGAEHLVVAAHEAGRPLTPESVRAGSIRHPRCGTSFIVVIAAVAAAIHPLLPIEPWSDRLLSRVVVVPVVAMIAYEVLTALGVLAARRPGGRVERLLLWPQRFTTRWPDDDQIEVAAVALQGALALSPAPDATDAPTRLAGASASI